MKNNVRELRQKKGMTATELSKKTSIAQSTLSNIENSKIPVFQGWKQRIADALDVPIEQVFPLNPQEDALLKEIREIKEIMKDIKEVD